MCMVDPATKKYTPAFWNGTSQQMRDGLRKFNPSAALDDPTTPAAPAAPAPAPTVASPIIPKMAALITGAGAARRIR
jgi:hypothetical protein